MAQSLKSMTLSDWFHRKLTLAGADRLWPIRKECEQLLALFSFPIRTNRTTGVAAMLAISRRRITAIAVTFGLLAMFPSILLAQPPVDDKTLATALRAGGNVILVRHGATFADQADTDPLHLDNVAAQRTLNDKGKTAARTFGEALRAGAVPVGAVYTSKFDRAYQTAAIAGLREIETTLD